jgi:lipid-binding SYLF domain-containing protein
MKNITRSTQALGAALIAALICTNAVAAGKLDQRMANSIQVMRDFTEIPENAIPDALLKNAYGVAVFPGVIKVGLGFGARYGKGVLVVRQDDGSWSSPSFIALGGGSFGWQLGAQSTDLVLVFKNERSIQNIYSGKVTLTGDASAAAGPVGRQTSAGTDGRLNAAIYSYARNRGLFAGVSLGGGWLGMDRKSNQTYYGNSMSPEQILTAKNMATPLAASQFVEIMTATAPDPGRPETYRTAAAPVQTPRADADVRVYTIEPLESVGDETAF